MKLTVKQAKNKAGVGFAAIIGGILLTPFAAAYKVGAPYSDIVQWLPFEEIAALPFIVGVALIVWGVFTAKSCEPYLSE